MSLVTYPLDAIIVTAKEMRQIEERLFAAGMPVAALMEKAAGLIATRIGQGFPVKQFPQVGILVGPGHNGGDALVVARELWIAGYKVSIFSPFSQLKELTASHFRYLQHLNIPIYSSLEPLASCDLIVEGLFGFGLTRSLTKDITQAVQTLNQWGKTVISIDLPSGLHTDTGEVLGVAAVKATLSLCLGLWKCCYFQEKALSYLGKSERIDFGISLSDVEAVLSPAPRSLAVISAIARHYLPIPRPLVTHKYQQGHLLLICGSRRYGGGAILAGLAARASGVGMLSIAVPAYLKPLMLSHLPDALIIDCPETEDGAIAALPEIAADFEKYQVVACGPGLTVEAKSIVEQTLKAHCPLILDADALNVVAQLGTESTLQKRTAPTILTPHKGEFKRLFPHVGDNWDSLKTVAQNSQSIILLKGSKTIIANPQGSLRIIAESTPALARGGSGDVLTGLMGGLLAQNSHLNCDSIETVATAAYWHAQAGIMAASDRTELGVDAHTLTDYLIPSLKKIVKQP